MTQEEFNAFCKSLPHSIFVEQWGGAQVWKIGTVAKNKVYAIGGWNEFDDAGAQFCVSFKTSEMVFEILRDSNGCRPAPYLASRGMKWIQWTGPYTLDDEGLREHIRASYELVAKGLTKKLQKELGFIKT